MLGKIRPSWYLKAPEKTRKTWTVSEQQKIFTLSKEFRKTDDVIYEMGSSYAGLRRTQVHNQARLFKLASEGRCRQCGHLIPQDQRESNKVHFFCNECKSKNKFIRFKRRKKFLRHHICPLCETNPLFVDPKTKKELKTCVNCLSVSYRRRVAAGNCGICGKNPIDHSRSVALCTNCLDKQRDEK